MAFELKSDHWYSFRDSCVVVTERTTGLFTDLALGTIENVLFFLHGRFGHAATWGPLIQEFSSEYRCFTVDLPGFGRSFSVNERGFSLLEHASLIQQLVTRLTFPQSKVILIGHDVGGAVAQLYSLQDPQKVAALVLINTSCLTLQLSLVPLGIAGFQARYHLGKLLKDTLRMDEGLRSSLKDPWKKKYTRRALISGLRAIQDSWPSHYEKKARAQEICRLGIPVLLLWGSRDSMNPREMGINLAQKFPEAYFFENDQSGHWPHLEQTQWVHDRILEFMTHSSLGAEFMPYQKSLSL